MYFVSYVPAAFARATATEQQRHRRLRRFAREADAARFVNDCWRTGEFRVLEFVQARRVAGCWELLREF